MSGRFAGASGLIPVRCDDGSDPRWRLGERGGQHLVRRVHEDERERGAHLPRHVLEVRLGRPGPPATSRIERSWPTASGGYGLREHDASAHGKNGQERRDVGAALAVGEGSRAHAGLLFGRRTVSMPRP